MELGDGDSVTAAGGICVGLAKAFAGEAGSFAFGRILSAMGLGTDTSAIDAQLSQISTQIVALEAQMTGLVSQMTQIEYNGLAAPLSDIIATNTTLTSLFLNLTGVDTKNSAALATAKQAVSAELTQNIVLAPALWNQTLCGYAGVTGLIEAWNRVVQTHHTNFDVVAATAIQTQWETLDAQQALSVTYAIEYYNNAKQPDQAAAVMTTYKTNRTTQLALVLGGSAKSDSTEWTDAATKETATVVTTMSSLPPAVMLLSIDGGLMMCGTTIYGPIKRGDDEWLSDFNSSLSLLQNWIVQETGVIGTWNPPDTATLIDLLNHFGGSVGGGGADSFGTAMTTSGFTFPDGPIRLWTGLYYDSLTNHPFRNVFVDGDTWWNPSTQSDDSAMLLLARTPSADEVKRYWYPPS